SIGARTILVDNELWSGSPYRPVLRKIADELNVPLVDSLQLIGGARERIERELEANLGLKPDSSSSAALPLGSGGTSVVFRVDRGTVDVPKRLSIVGTHEQLGSIVPNTVAMHDDGTGGDQKAGDGVWTFTANLPSGRPVFYVYTNSGEAGRWEGLDLPH